MNWEDFPFFSQFFTMHSTCRGCGYSTEPGRQALTGSGGLRYAAKILYEIMLAGFLCLTKPSLLAIHGSIAPCPGVLAGAFLCFVGIISTVSRQLRYSPSRSCVCLPPGFLTLWLNLPSCRFASGCCRGSLCVSLVFVYALHGLCRELALCGLGICVCFARSLPGSLGFARSVLAQHYIECHHKAESHHKCYGGAV